MRVRGAVVRKCDFQSIVRNIGFEDDPCCNWLQCCTVSLRECKRDAFIGLLRVSVRRIRSEMSEVS
jgi:hypothetical protein